MTYALTHRMTFVGRRALVALVAVLAVIALLATASTSAHQTLVRSHVTADGTNVVSGYDGGVALAPAKP